MKSSSTKPVPAAEFTRNFGHYRMLAQREAIAVSSHGRVTGYFVRADEYEDFLRYKKQRKAFATADLPKSKIKAIEAARMDARHEHLNALMDSE